MLFRCRTISFICGERLVFLFLQTAFYNGNFTKHGITMPMTIIDTEKNIKIFKFWVWYYREKKLTQLRYEPIILKSFKTNIFKNLKSKNEFYLSMHKMDQVSCLKTKLMFDLFDRTTKRTLINPSGYGIFILSSKVQTAGEYITFKITFKC